MSICAGFWMRLTVKKHTINIYRKLDVNGRHQAVAATRRLGVLPVK
jgi:ATP/maltotriose-dependent transcriptional regulator MalT